MGIAKGAADGITGRWVVGGAAAPGSPLRMLDGNQDNGGASNG
jgi:hypothetical protein